MISKTLGKKKVIGVEGFAPMSVFEEIKKKKPRKKVISAEEFRDNTSVRLSLDTHHIMLVKYSRQAAHDIIHY